MQIEEEEPHPFAFLNPFAIEVWLVLVGSIIVLGIVLHYFDHSDDDEGKATSISRLHHFNSPRTSVIRAIFVAGRIGGTISLTIPKLKQMEEGLIESKPW